MGAGHRNLLYVDGHSGMHRLPAQCKLAATLAFVIAVVVTPREAFWAFGLHLLLVSAAVAWASLGLATVARRLSVEIPFLAFAVLLPFIGRGSRMEVLGLSLSVEGSWAAWNILAKASLGTLAGILLAGTTTPSDLLVGLERLRVPRLFTSIAGFMIRYLEVIGDQVRRMQVAQRSRGHDPNWIGQGRAVATTAGTLFIRSFERGERVYVSMLARGYDGTMPRLDQEQATAREWGRAAIGPAVAGVVSMLAWSALR